MKKRVIEIKNEQQSLVEELQEIQRKCKHIRTNEKDCGNTGNYDPTADRYWTEYHCLMCDKKWIVYHTQL